MHVLLLVVMIIVHEPAKHPNARMRIGMVVHITRFVMIIYGNIFLEGAGVLVQIRQATIVICLHMNIAANVVHALKNECNASWFTICLFDVLNI